MDNKKEYIERDKTLLSIMQNGTDAGTVGVIMNLPTADVAEVVRCRDCVFNQRERGNGMIDCYKSIRLVAPDHFCGYGKRKEEL